MARATKGRRSQFKLVGGPYDGAWVQLYSAGTLAFTVPSFDPRPGRYVHIQNGGVTLEWEFMK